MRLQTPGLVPKTDRGVSRIEYDGSKLYVAVDVTDERKVYLRSNP